MRCKKCKTPNERNANFCENCGTPIRRVSKKRHFKQSLGASGRNSKVTERFNVLSYMISHKQIWVFMSIFLTVLIVVVAINSGNRFNGSNGRFVDIASVDPNIEAQVFNIASNFVCGCGSCNEESLDICKCNYAVEERKLIRDYLELKKKPSDIIAAVVSRYGGLKPDIDITEFQNNDVTLIPINSDKLSHTASYNDRTSIYSAFECPCGQCGIKELKDCNCNHKNGATEVKNFIDSKIATGEFSVSQIIDMVDQKYGGKKL